MKKLLKHGRALVAYISIFSIVAVSIFTGIAVTADATSCGGTIVEKWDKVSDGVTGDWYDGTFETGDGSENNPFIISSAEELAWVCKNTTVENSKGVYYKVDPEIKAFDMNTVSGVDLTVDGLSAQQVKDKVAGKILGKVWHPGYAGCFAGSFDGSGVTIYGLYAGPAYYNQNSYDNNQPYGCNYAALFSKIDATTASFKNFSIKNSYFTGEISAAVYAESIVNNGSATIENVIVSNCYIESKSGGYYGGALVGFCRYEAATSTASKVKINNCLVYDNIIDSKLGSAVRLIGTLEAYCANASGQKVRDYENFSITNTIAIGCDIENTGSYWQKDSKMYSNCYTTGNPAVENTTITKLPNAEAAKGEEALKNMPGLDQKVWFFNTTTYPQLRAFHTFVYVDNGDGTHSEACACGFASVASNHYFVSGVCAFCAYEDPCLKGHTLKAVEGKEATKTENGIKAHEYCKVCEKLFIDGVEVKADDVIIPMLVTTSTFTGNYDTDLMGSGTKKDPYIITSADELAAVALGVFSSTETTYFKVLDSITAFYMNGGETVAAMTSAEAVKEYFTTNPGINWKPTGTFKGQFDGSGATVYGLYCNGTGQYDYAGLFPKIEGHSGIKNIAVKNSYFVSFNKDGAIAALIGGTVWKGDSNVNTSAAIENVVIANNYIASTNSTTSYGASVLMGRFFEKHYASVNNCMMYDNLVENAYTGVDIRTGMISGYAGTGTNTSFNNIIAIGVTPWTVVEMADGTYAHSGWFMTNMEGQYRNIYTDQSAEKLQAYNPTKNSDSALKNFNINVLTKEQMMGAAAKTNITTLDEDVWFFNTTTYPQIRVFHEITAESVGVDGHENEQDVCCGLQLLGDDIIPHSYTSSSVCSICGYVFPCANGHEFTDIPAKDASYESAGNIAHKHCSKCDKKYPMDAAIDESVNSAYADSDVIIPQMLPYDNWDGTPAPYFWMNNEGDGSASNPFIIHSAEQLAAVATANLKYDASKPTSASFDISKYTLNGNVLDTTGLCFKVRDGLNYFYLNGGEALAALTSAEDVKAYFETNGGQPWNPDYVFNGTFNGNGAEIYGLYSVGNTTNALFPKVDASTSIKNVTLKNSYLITSEGNVNSIAAGGLIGLAQWHTDSAEFGTINVRSCVVANNYICSLSADAQYGRVGAVAGNVFSNSIAIKDTLVYGNLLVNGPNVPAEYETGLVAYASGGNSTFKNIVTIGTVPYTEKANWHLYDNSKFVNVYTDTGITIADGAPYDYKAITKLTKDEMTGDKAKENMPALDWVSFWITNDGQYPTPRIVNVKDYTPGSVWTGEIAKEFPSGDGSVNNPYAIPSTEYLALMLTTENTGLYYKLIGDIVINDTTVAEWKDTAKQWFTSEDVKPFGGYLNGNGYTVSGLFYNDIDPDDSVGLIPVKDSGDVTNLTIADSYIYSNSANAGAVIGSVVDNASAPIALQGINVEDTVVIEGNAVAGGIIGKAGESVVRISNCISKANITASGTVGGIIGEASAGVSLKNSISVGLAPFGEANSGTAKNVYTNVETDISGATVLSSDAMKGAAAATNMSGLDFDQYWTTVDGDYPTLKGVIETTNGVVGEVWSGGVASAFAGGNGSAEDPYLIATPEQLARCVTKHEHGKHYKLIADIYLNDVDSTYWDIKVGCNQWYHNRSGASWGLFKNGGSFDGDGHIVYGLYFERTGYMEPNMGAYLGLFSTVGQKALIQNVAISEAYIAGSNEYLSDSENSKWFSESAGALVGSFVRWDTSYKNELTSTYYDKKLTQDPKFWDNMPIVKNCLVDNKTYVSATYAGGLFGYCDEPFRAYDCIFTGSLKGTNTEHTGGISGQDTANGAYYINCVSLPQTCDRPYGGWANSNWRSTESQWPTTVTDSYYFSKYNRVNSGEQIANPADRIGENAKNAMKLLDWENTWMVIEDGTPIQQIFAKHHTEEEYLELSDRAFLPPYVTVSFVTGDENIVVENQVARMYTEISLPVISREGYTFTGWYVFDD